MSMVTVICPGARRHNIKVTPNTVLLQVLEQACGRQKLDPSLYAIKHHGKLCDLSLPLRYSGIPNNGKLELVAVDKPRSDGGDVVVAVQTADGTRVQSTFHSSASLWDVLIHHKFDSSPDGMEPSLIYMRQEVWGEVALRAKTLRAIGLSSGRGILRLTHRKPSVAVVGESVASAEPVKREETFPTSLEQSTHETTLSGGNRGQATKMEEGGVSGEMEVEGGERGRNREVEGREGTVSSKDEPRRKPLHSEQVAMDPTEEEQLPYFPAHPISYFSDINMESFENTLGEIEEPSETETAPLSLSPHHSPMMLNTQPSTAASLVHEALQQHIHSPHFPPEVVAAQLEELKSPFAQFAGLSRPHPLSSTVFPPQPKVYDVRDPCERELVVYHQNDSLQLTPTEEVPDTFFQHTVTDLQVMHSDLKRQAKTSDAPLMTQAMRSVRDEMKLEKYKKSIVRVYFPDQWVLQGCFRPRESLKMLVAFIRENLSDPQVKFHLYTTPPKCVMKSAKITFAEAGFVPTAVVYVGVEEGKPHPQLSDSALQHAASALRAEIIHTRHRPHNEQSRAPPTAGPSHQPRPPHQPKTASSGAAAASSSQQTAGQKVPKWFKPGH